MAVSAVVSVVEIAKIKRFRRDGCKDRSECNKQEWIPDDNQRRGSVGAVEGLNPYSLENAKVADAKRMVQKREKRLLGMLPESETAVYELRDVYVKLKSVKKLAFQQPD